MTCARASPQSRAARWRALAVLDHVHVHEGRRRDVEHEHRLWTSSSVGELLVHQVSRTCLGRVSDMSRLDEQRREAAKGRREGRIGEAGEEGEDLPLSSNTLSGTGISIHLINSGRGERRHLPGDAGRVEDGKEGVAEPEDGVEGARLPARPDQVVEVEGVPRHLDQRP